MTTRRRFIEILPLAGLGLGLGVLAGCGDKAPVPAPMPAPMPAPDPAPAPAPAVQAPAATEPAPTSAAAPADTSSLPMVSPQDPMAQTLGYVAVASTTDKGKHPNYAEGQLCSNCALYAGAAGSEKGPCPLFPGRNVAAAGWCVSYVRKTG